MMELHLCTDVICSRLQRSLLLMSLDWGRGPKGDVMGEMLWPRLSIPRR